MILQRGEYRGFRWKITDSGLGYRNGYIYIPEGHKWYGKKWYELKNIVVHGGITFANYGAEGEFMVGMDCGHGEDKRDPDLTIIYKINSVEKLLLEMYDFISGDLPPDDINFGKIWKDDDVLKEIKKVVDQAL